MPTLARLYQHADYKGSFKDIILPNNFPMPRYVVASYNNFFYNFNDRMSSFKLYPFPLQSKNSFVFFQHSNFDGRGQSYGYQANRDVNYVGNNLNDIASSAVIINHSDAITLGNYTLGGGVSFQELAGPSYLNLRAQFEQQLQTLKSGPLQKVVLRNAPIRYKFELDNQNRALVRVHLPVRLILKDPLPDDDIEIYIWLLFTTSGNPPQLSVSVPYNPRIEKLRPIYKFILNLINLVLPGRVQGIMNGVREAINNTLREMVKGFSLEYPLFGTQTVKLGFYLMPGNAVANQPIVSIPPGININIPMPIRRFTLQDYYISNADYDCTLVVFSYL